MKLKRVRVYHVPWALQHSKPGVMHSCYVRDWCSWALNYNYIPSIRAQKRTHGSSVFTRISPCLSMSVDCTFTSPSPSESVVLWFYSLYLHVHISQSHCSCNYCRQILFPFWVIALLYWEFNFHDQWPKCNFQVILFFPFDISALGSKIIRYNGQSICLHGHTCTCLRMLCPSYSVTWAFQQSPHTIADNCDVLLLWLRFK